MSPIQVTTWQVPRWTLSLDKVNWNAKSWLIFLHTDYVDRMLIWYSNDTAWTQGTCFTIMNTKHESNYCPLQNVFPNMGVQTYMIDNNDPIINVTCTMHAIISYRKYNTCHNHIRLSMDPWRTPTSNGLGAADFHDILVNCVRPFKQLLKDCICWNFNRTDFSHLDTVRDAVRSISVKAKPTAVL